MISLRSLYWLLLPLLNTLSVYSQDCKYSEVKGLAVITKVEHAQTPDKPDEYAVWFKFEPRSGELQTRFQDLALPFRLTYQDSLVNPNDAYIQKYNLHQGIKFPMVFSQLITGHCAPYKYSCTAFPTDYALLHLPEPAVVSNVVVKKYPGTIIVDKVIQTEKGDYEVWVNFIPDDPLSVKDVVDWKQRFAIEATEPIDNAFIRKHSLYKMHSFKGWAKVESSQITILIE